MATLGCIGLGLAVFIVLFVRHSPSSHAKSISANEKLNILRQIKKVQVYWKD